MSWPQEILLKGMLQRGLENLGHKADWIMPTWLRGADLGKKATTTTKKLGNATKEVGPTLPECSNIINQSSDAAFISWGIPASASTFHGMSKDRRRQHSSRESRTHI